MRDKIADIDIHNTLLRENFGHKKLGNFYADQILTLIKEEIEKVETPHFYADWGGESGRAGWDKCRQAILKALEV